MLNNQVQRVVNRGEGFSWRPVTGGISQGSILGSILWKLLINDLQEGMEYTLSNFTDNT